MLAIAIKIAVTAILVVAISEVAKRSSLLGAVLASIPLTSVLAMIWLYVDTGDPEKAAELATGCPRTRHDEQSADHPARHCAGGDR